MRALLFLGLAAGCAMPPEPCEWDGFDEQGWALVEFENECGLPSHRPAELGCVRQTSEVVETDGQCGKLFEYRCANELRMVAAKTQDPDRVAYVYHGRECVSSAVLAPAKP